MQNVTRFFPRFSRDEEGATMVEYGLLVALIAAVMITVLIALGGADDNSGLRGLFGGVGGEIEANTP